ncbi:MAG: DUF1028 domain-containing protein [Paracoccaceae bacterium]|nr:DUF1028 domain-containing protein [Paracoccaceae bacterium]MDE2912944.1 DUF1028 domain-containing protein [Paracoccaceae bacterium]
MTFSLAGRCERTGMLGAAVTTSSIAVGARCLHARAGVGAAMSQNITDPSLGPALLDLMAAGRSAAEAVSAVVESAPDIEFRQLTAVDTGGGTGHFTGSKTLGVHGVDCGDDCVAAGNLLAHTGVPEAMVRTFRTRPGDHLAERLLAGLEAGLGAGGEAGPAHSAALLVVDRVSWPLVDLRVDWDDGCPVTALRRLWKQYCPQMDDYVVRALNPSAAPSYGVAGDP